LSQNGVKPTILLFLAWFCDYSASYFDIEKQ